MKMNRLEKVTEDLIEICENNRQYFEDEKLDDFVKVIKEMIETNKFKVLQSHIYIDGGLIFFYIIVFFIFIFIFI